MATSACSVNKQPEGVDDILDDIKDLYFAKITRIRVYELVGIIESLEKIRTTLRNIK